MYRITIENLQENTTGADALPAIKVYGQSVPDIDLRRVIDAINYKPRVYKPRAKKSEPQ